MHRIHHDSDQNKLISEYERLIEPVLQGDLKYVVALVLL